MIPHRRLIGFSLVFLLLVVQALWLTHRFGHDLSSDAQEEIACEFCLALHGMGAAPPTPERLVAAIPSGEHCPEYAFIIRVDAQSIQPRQQGPPRFS
ncbi:MAG: hypothetical protein FWF12_11210 [Betaproteobacteria bacterium]|nr:hypothetical protein [Betaproteobacteria bacterium]